MAITIYGKPDAQCFGCKKTKERFTKAGVDYVFVDITDEASAAALDYVTSDLGYSQAPVVVLSDQDHWSGLNPPNIERAITMHAAT